MAEPVEFVVKKLPYDLSSHGGLALVGRLFKRINLPAMIDPQYPVRGGIANSDIIKCYLALLTLGKNDFEAVEGFRSQRFAHQALGLRAVPSSATLRQRFDAMGTQWSELADQINRAVLGLHINGAPIDFGALPTGHQPQDNRHLRHGPERHGQGGRVLDLCRGRRLLPHRAVPGHARLLPGAGLACGQPAQCLRERIQHRARAGHGLRGE